MWSSALGGNGEARTPALELLGDNPGNWTLGGHRIKVLVLIPSLAVGGAETDLVRTLPRIDRSRYQITVCTFLERGELGKALEDEGIEVIGPLSFPLLPVLRFAGRLVRRALATAKLVVRPAYDALSTLYRVFSHIGRQTALHLEAVLRVPFLRSCFAAIRQGIRVFVRAIIEVARFPYSISWGISYLLQVLLLARPIAQYIRASETDIIHAILPNAYLVGACAKLLSRRPLILMSRVSLNLYQKRYKLVGFIERHILHHGVDAAIGNSRAVLQDLMAEGVKGAKLRLVYNGIDVRAFTSQMATRSTARKLLCISEQAIVFSVVANLHPWKGHRDLLRALAALPDSLPSDWICLLVGNDPEDRLPELTRLCLDYGLSRNIAFLGLRRDVPMILSASDIHISASHQEGLPNNVIEAMCARLPIVATSVGGVSELVVNGQTGYLLPPRDADHMAEALVNLALAPTRRRAFGEAGYQRVSTRFGIGRNVESLEAIYFDLAGKQHDYFHTRDNP
jgi:glycosyltransferase involved in cell wall biosynthesis